VPGAATAASLTAAAWDSDNAPDLNASAVAGNSATRLAVSAVALATPSEVPEARAIHSSAVRCPARAHASD